MSIKSIIESTSVHGYTDECNLSELDNWSKLSVIGYVVAEYLKEVFAETILPNITVEKMVNGWGIPKKLAVELKCYIDNGTYDTSLMFLDEYYEGEVQTGIALYFMLGTHYDDDGNVLAGPLYYVGGFISNKTSEQNIDYDKLHSLNNDNLEEVCKYVYDLLIEHGQFSDEWFLTKDNLVSEK